MQLTAVAGVRSLDWLTGNTTTAPALPLMVRLMVANGGETAVGTQVSGGSYTPEEIGFGPAAQGTGTSNDTLIRFENLPAVTVVGVEVWDSADIPVRWWYGALEESRTFIAGDPAEFPVGALVLTQG